MHAVHGQISQRVYKGMKSLQSQLRTSNFKMNKLIIFIVVKSFVAQAYGYKMPTMTQGKNIDIVLRF